MKTAIIAMILATAIASPASAGGFKIEKPCGTRGAEPCIVLAQKQTYPSDLKFYEMYRAGRSLGRAPTGSQTIETTFNISSR